MKIAVVGYSGAGKSTLAQKLSEIYKIDVLHFDTVQFLPDWEIRDEKEKDKLTKEFMDTHESWIIDGNYSALYFDRRMEEADIIILLLFNRFSCFLRAYKRYLKFKNNTRPDMADGCNEKFDFEFAKWILHGGRIKHKKDRYKSVIQGYKEKAVVIKNQRQLDRYIESISTKNRG